MTVCLPIRFDSLVELSAGERASVEALIAQCRTADGFDPCLHFETHLNADRSMPAWRLAWAEAAVGDDGRDVAIDTLSDDEPRPVKILAGAACAFAPSRAEGEISACVAPVFRRQGIFAALYESLAETLGRSGAQSVLIVCESASPYAASIARRFGCSLDHGEKLMSLPKERTYGIRPPDDLRLVPVSLAFIAEAISISCAAFGDTPDDAKAFTLAVLADDAREQFIARTGEGAIGMVSLSRDGPSYTVHGLGVLPESRRKGLGGSILDACLVVLAKRGAERISLEVDADNAPALALYRSRGFVEESRADYWRVPSAGMQIGAAVDGKAAG